MNLHCPHCHNVILVVSPQTNEVVCPGCGSSFRVEGGMEAVTTTAPLTRRVGKFELMERVGAGAFGAVYRARDAELDRIVAVKVAHPSLLDSAQERERFLREARAAAQLRHPNIAVVHEVREFDGVPTIISDFVDGVTLRELLEIRRLTFRETAELVAQVALALDYAHSMGLVHRDIKPANIMIEYPKGVNFSGSFDPAASSQGNKRRSSDSASAPTSEGSGSSASSSRPRPILLDFGLALREDAEITMTVDGQIIGTPAYMSPEQAAGRSHHVDRRSDVYSLGVVLYELLCGEIPFRGSKVMMVHQVLREEPRAPRKLNDKIPRDLETICLKALSKAPARRYPTAEAMANDLRRWLHGEPITARRVSSTERLIRWCLRNPVVSSLVATAVVLLVAVAGVSTIAAVRLGRLAHRERQQKELVSQETAKALELAAANSRLANMEKSARAKADQNAASAQQHSRRAEQALYNAHMNLAGIAWEAGRIGEVERLVELYRPAAEAPQIPIDMRGLEWWFLNRLVPRPLMTLTGYGSTVRSAAFSPDGSVVASAGLDGTVRICDARDGTVRHTLMHANVRGVAYHPKGGRLVSASHNKTLKVWDSTTGEELLTLTGHGTGVSCVAFSPDGTRLASATGDYDPTKPGGEVKVWDAATGLETASLLGHSKSVFALAFSPDGTRLASVSWDQTVKIWDPQDGRQLATWNGHNRGTFGVSFSPDGSCLATCGGDGMVRIWDSATGQQKSVYRGHNGSVWTVAYGSRSSRLASGGLDGFVKVWDTAADRELLSFRANDASVRSVAWNAEETRLATAGGERMVKLWDVARPEGGNPLTLHGHAGYVVRLAISADGKRLASGGSDQSVKLWNLETAQELRTLQGHTDVVFSTGLSRDGSRVVSASLDGTVRVWNADTGQELKVLTGHTGQVYDAAISPDGALVASAGSDRTVKLWNASTGQELRTLEGHLNSVQHVAFSPDGSCLASCSGTRFRTDQPAEVKLWSVESGDEKATLTGHEGAVLCVAFSSDGQRLVSGGVDATIRIWSISSGRELATVRGHSSYVFSVAFSSDGRRIVSGSHDGTMKVWDAASGQLSFSLKGPDPHVGSVVISENGERMCLGGGDFSNRGQPSTTLVWDIRP